MKAVFYNRPREFLSRAGHLLVGNEARFFGGYNVFFPIINHNSVIRHECQRPDHMFYQLCFIIETAIQLGAEIFSNR